MSIRYLIRSGLLLLPLSALVGLLGPTLSIGQTQEQNLKYSVGQFARETIYATDTIRVSDPGSYRDLFERVRSEIPPIYGYRKSTSEEVATALQQSWEATRESFLSSLETVFGKRTFRPNEIASSSFSRFTDNFQERNSGVPINDSLARRWASGNVANTQIQNHTNDLNTFLTAYFIGPDEASDSTYSSHESVDLITISDREPRNLDELSSQPIAKLARRQFLPISQARQLFVRQSSIPNNTLKNYLAQFVQPNTTYLETLSIERWETAQSSLNKEIVFEAGDVIVRRGEEITPIIKEVLDHIVVDLRYKRLRDSVKIELAKENPAKPNADSGNQTQSNRSEPKETPAQAPAQPEEPNQETRRLQGKLPPLLSPTTVVQSDNSNQATAANRTGSDSQQATSGLTSLLNSMDILYRWIIGFGVVLITAVVLYFYFVRRHRTPAAEEHSTIMIDDSRQNMFKSLTTHLTQTLFKQRQTLLKSKENATAQVAAMEDRLAKLQPEIFDKLKAYEDKIRDLQEQLGNQDQPELSDAEKAVPKPLFEDLTDTVEGEENFDTAVLNESETANEDKEVPFPGQPFLDDLDEDGPADLLEEVLEDLENEENLEKRIAKGSEP